MVKNNKMEKKNYPMTLINNLREFARKTPLRTLYRRLRGTYLNRHFKRAMAEIINDQNELNFNHDVLASLCLGWGNPDTAANVEFLDECANYARESSLPILECGSGLTTIIAGLVAKKTNNTLWSLENMKFWHNRVKKYLKMYHINSATIYYSVLKNYGDFTWYAPPLDSMPEKFSLVICDGPSNNKGGRYGLLPVMKQKLAPGCIILLHNVDRKIEKENLERWAAYTNLSYEIRGSAIPNYGVVRLK
jgi:hypothetical protein